MTVSANQPSAAWRIHRGLYRLSNGRFGLRRPNNKTYGLMWVTTIGRRSGQRRPVMLGYFDDGPNLVTMAMNGWAAPEPAWWLDVQAAPDVIADLVGERRPVTGRIAVGEERDRLRRHLAVGKFFTTDHFLQHNGIVSIW